MKEFKAKEIDYILAQAVGYFMLGGSLLVGTLLLLTAGIVCLKYHPQNFQEFMQFFPSGRR